MTNTSTCLVIGCGRPRSGRGYCSAHYQRLMKNGRVGGTEIQPRRSTCSIEGCERKHFGHGLCKLHYRRRGKPEPRPMMPAKGLTCTANGCDRPRVARGLCNAHYLRLKTTGSTEGDIRGYGDGHIDRQGYRVIVLRGHPNANKYGRMREHVAVMAEVVGRALRKGETVHHLNGDRLDNRPENLELWTGNHGSGQRVSDRVRAALHLLKDYSDIAWLWPAQADDLRQALGSYDPTVPGLVLALPPPKHVFQSQLSF